MTCEGCLVICILTNVHIFGVYRKVILSFSDNVMEDCFTQTKEASDPLTKAALQAMQTASSNSCCGFSSTWCFPSIQYGLHAILPWSVGMWAVYVSCVGKVYGRKLCGQLLQHCDHAVLHCQNCQLLGMLEIGGKGDCNN